MNKSQKITDLEEFAFNHIIKPYYFDLIGKDKDQVSNKVIFSLLKIADMLSQETEWSLEVKKRIKSIGFYFPLYIHHPLVDALKDVVEVRSDGVLKIKAIIGDNESCWRNSP